MRESDGLQLPERAVHLGRLRRQLGDLSRSGKLVAQRSKLRATLERTLEHCKSLRLHLVENPSGKSARVFRLGSVCVGTHVMGDATGKLLRDGEILDDMAGRRLRKESIRSSSW